MSVIVIPMHNLPAHWYMGIPDEWHHEVFRLDTNLRMVYDDKLSQLLIMRRCEEWFSSVTIKGEQVFGWQVQFAIPPQRQHLAHILDTLRRGDMWAWGPNREAALEERNRRTLERSEAPVREAQEDFDAHVRETFTKHFDDSVTGRVQTGYEPPMPKKPPKGEPLIWTP